MPEKNFTELGRELGETVQKAIQSGDFSKLRDTVGETMKTVVEHTVSSAQRTFSSSKYHTPPKPPQGCQAPYQPFVGKRPVVQPYAAKPRLLPVVRRCKGVGALIITIGNIALSISGIIFICLWIEMWREMSLSENILVNTLLALVALQSIWLIAMGSHRRKMVKRYQKYCALLAPRRFCSIDAMSRETGKSVKFVADELGYMLEKGWFPGGHLDHKNTSMMLGEDLYQNYLAAEAARLKREELETIRKENPDAPEAVIAEGKEWVQKIRKANDALPGKEISDKLDRLELVVGKIFAHVEQNPDKLPDIRRFMNYYLPTTVKLVNSYRDFEVQPIQVEYILKSKQEILETLDMINTAFETLLNDLYEYDMLDISTDISALKTVLTQEGLVDESAENKNNGGLLE